MKKGQKMEIQEKKKNPDLCVIIAFAIMAIIKLVYLVEGMIVQVQKILPKLVINQDVILGMLNGKLKPYLLECFYSIFLFAVVIFLIHTKRKGLLFSGVFYLISVKSLVTAYKALIVCFTSADVKHFIDGIVAALLNVALIAVLAVLVLQLLSETLEINRFKENRELFTNLYQILYPVFIALVIIHIIISFITFKSLFGIDFVNIAWIFAIFSLNKMIAPKNEEEI